MANEIEEAERQSLLFDDKNIELNEVKIQQQDATHNDQHSQERIVNNEVNHIKRLRYGWEKLHSAARDSDSDTLERICNELDHSRINTLTMLSENALHVLLAHNTSAQSFNVSCQNGQKLKMSRIINKEPKSVIDCAKILIDKEIDVNHSNFWNETPILIAIKRKYFEVVKLLLKVKEIDLDSCRDTISGKTARELLKGEDNLGLLPTFSAAKKTQKVLFQFLKSGNEESFVKYNGGKIGEFVNSFDGDNNLNSSCTLLQYCFRRGLIFLHNMKDKCEDSESRVMDIFCKYGMARSILHLLENGADVNFSLQKFENGRSLLEAAIIKGYYPMVALIIGRKEYQSSLEKISLQPTDLENICQTFTGISEATVSLLENHTRCIDLNKTLSIVLSRIFELIQMTQNESVRTKLLEAVEKNFLKLLRDGVRIINQENQLLLLKFSGSLCWTSANNSSRSCFCQKLRNSVLEDIDPEVLKIHLNECVEQEDKDVFINLHSFLREGNKNVLPVLDIFLSSSKLQESFNHPVFKILIMRQWQGCSLQWSWCKMKYFYINLIFYLIFYALVNIYILCKFNDFNLDGVTVSSCICFLVFLWKEIFQFVANSSLYVKEMSNYFEIAFIICMMFVYCSDAKWVDIFEVLVVLISNIVLLSLLVNLPACAEYIIILRTILFYLRYWFFYFIQFFAFAISFYILFSKDNQVWYADIPNKLFETFILFTGNLEYMDTPWKEKANNSTNKAYFHNFPSKEIFSKFIFILFVLFIAIILQNLLVGLLVIDVENLHKDVALSEQLKRAGFVVRLEKYFGSSYLQCLSRILGYKKMEIDRRFKVTDDDRNVLTASEKQNLDFILTKKFKKPDVLKTVKNYVTTKLNSYNSARLRNERDDEIVEKLAEIVKKLGINNDLTKKIPPSKN